MKAICIDFAHLLAMVIASHGEIFATDYYLEGMPVDALYSSL